MKINSCVKSIVLVAFTIFFIFFLKKSSFVINLRNDFILKKNTKIEDVLESTAKITGINDKELFIEILKLSEMFNAQFFTTTFNFVKAKNGKFNELLSENVNVNEYNFTDYFSNKKEFFEWLVVATQIKFNNDNLTESNVNNFLKINSRKIYTELKKTKNTTNNTFTKDKYEYIVIFGSHFTNIKTRLNFVLKSNHINKNFIILTNSRIININNIDRDTNGNKLKTYTELQQTHNNKSSDVDIAYFVIKDNFTKEYKKDDFENPETEKLFLNYLQKQKRINQIETEKLNKVINIIKHKTKVKTNKNVINEKSIANYAITDPFYKNLNITVLDTNMLHFKEVSANTDEMLLNFLHFMQKGNKKEFFNALTKINIAFVSSNPYFFLKKEQITKNFTAFFKDEIKERKIKHLLKNNVEVVVCSNILKNNTTVLREYLKMFADIIYLQYKENTQDKDICLKYECLIKNKNIKKILEN